MDRALKLIFDIETVATDKAKEFVQGKTYELPGNIKPLDSWPVRFNAVKDDDIREGHIQDWQEEQRKKIKSHVTLKQLKDLEDAALNWWMSKVCSIAWVCVDPIDNEIVEREVCTSKDEQEILHKFFTYLEGYKNDINGIIGKNSVFFDCPYLVGRAIANDIGIPHHLRTSISKLGDIDQIFGVMSSRNSGITRLKNYAFGLGIDGKLGDGAGVEKLYESGNLKQLADYNMRDVEIVAEMYCRWNKAYLIH